LAYRPTLAQVRYRLKKELVRKLEAAAKRNKQSVNEEVAARLLDSFEHENWREERERLALMFRAIREVPTGLKEIADELEVSAERDLQNNIFPKKER
jgi:hypothetical protein